MLTYFFRHGLTVTFNHDIDTKETEAVHRIADDKIEALRSEVQEEIDRNVRQLEERIDEVDRTTDVN